MKVLKLQTTDNCNAFFSQVLLFVMCKSSFTQHVCDRPEKLFLSLAVCTDMYQLAATRIADVCVCVSVCGTHITYFGDKLNSAAVKTHGRHHKSIFPPQLGLIYVSLVLTVFPLTRREEKRESAGRERETHTQTHTHTHTRTHTQTHTHTNEAS